MSGNEVNDAIGELGKALGIQLLQNLPSYLSAESMVEKAGEILAKQIHDTILEILSDPDNSTTLSLVDRFYQEIDDSEVIEKIAKPLADSFITYLKEQMWTDLVTAIIKETQIDENDLMDRVATKLAERIRLDP